MDYKEYLQSPQWKAISKLAIQKAGFRCQLCNREGKLNVHHKTYENIFNEEMEDLIVLCEICHTRFHKTDELLGLIAMFFDNRAEMDIERGTTKI